MSKIKKEQNTYIPLTDWDVSPWSKEMYDRHEVELKKIHQEYKALKHAFNNDARMARWRWIERRGGLVMRLDNFGTLQPYIREDKYVHLSNMFDKFTEWLSFKEKKEISQEERSLVVREIFTGMKKPTMKVPVNIIAESNEEEMIKDALNNF